MPCGHQGERRCCFHRAWPPAGPMDLASPSAPRGNTSSLGTDFAQFVSSFIGAPVAILCYSCGDAQTVAECTDCGQRFCPSCISTCGRCRSHQCETCSFEHDLLCPGRPRSSSRRLCASTSVLALCDSPSPDDQCLGSTLSLFWPHFCPPWPCRGRCRVTHEDGWPCGYPCDLPKNHLTACMCARHSPPEIDPICLPCLPGLSGLLESAGPMSGPPVAEYRHWGGADFFARLSSENVLQRAPPGP